MSSLGRSTRLMAVGTVASRASGFLRTAAIAAVLGVQGVSAAYNVANTTPNIIYDLLLGGILTSVIVPLLVRAAREGAQAGEDYAERLLSLTVLALGVASVLLVLGAPLLVELYAGGLEPASRDLAVLFARFFLPQVVFYGAGAVMGAVLNVRGRFAAPMWAPVLNNVVVVVTCVVFLLLPGPSRLGAATITTAQVLVLGIGTTLGIVAQTAGLVPALRAAGFRLRLRTDLRGVGLGAVARLARWMLLYVVANQLSYLVVVRLATNGDLPAGRGYPSFVFAFALWQLPHAVIAVSVITALLPRMSEAASDRRLSDLRASLNHGLRLTVSVLVPAAVAYLALGQVLAVAVFGHLRTSVPEAQFIGSLLAVFALGLVPYSAYQLQLRAFYALQDTRTPTLVNLWVNATAVGLDLLLYALLPPGARVLGLAFGQSASFVIGLALCSRVLSRRIGGLDGRRVVRTTARAVTAALFPGLAAYGLVQAVLGRAGTGPAGSLLALVLGGTVLAGGYVLLAHRMRLRELDELLGPLAARVAGPGR